MDPFTSRECSEYNVWSYLAVKSFPRLGFTVSDKESNSTNVDNQLDVGLDKVVFVDTRSGFKDFVEEIKEEVIISTGVENVL